jgi:putative DNA primase/helicase
VNANDGLRDAVRAHVAANVLAAYERVLSAPPAPKSGGASGEIYWHCPFHHPDPDPDFRLDPGKGTWFCDVCHFGGDLFALVERLENCGFRQALLKLADCFGLQNGHNGNAARGKKQKAREKRKPKPASGDDNEATRHTALAGEIWSASLPAPGTPTECYLRARGITGDVPSSIRHHPALRHPSGQELPAMVAVVQESKSGELIAVHRTFLKPDGSGKAEVAPQKMALGPTGSGAARFARVTEKVAYTEGLEDALTIQEVKQLPARAMLGSFRAEAIGDSVSEVYFCADREPSGVSERHARTAGAQLLAKKPGLKVFLTQPRPRPDGRKVDFNDVLQERGAEGVCQEFDAGLEELQPPAVSVDQPPAPYSDIALSNDFAASREPDLRYVKKSRDFLIYDPTDTRWALDEKMVPWAWGKEFLTQKSHELYDEVYSAAILDGKDKHDAEREARSAASAIASKSKVAAVMDLVRSHPSLPTTLDRFDRNVWELNVPGSQVVNLKTSQLREARRHDYFTKVAAVAPDPFMPTPIFDRFVSEIMGSEVPVEICKCASCVTLRAKNVTAEQMREPHLQEVARLVEYLLRLYGYALTADTRTPLLIIQIGEGGNGKGVLNDFVSQRILGLAPQGYSAEIPIEYLLDRKTDQHPTGLMNLFHARLAIARESEMGTRWNEGTVKRLTGSDVISARRMREDFTDFLPSHKLIVFGQHKPALRGAHEAAWRRRVHMIPFPQKWDRDEDKLRHVLRMNEEISDELAREAPGVLHKLIHAVGRYHRNKRDLAIPDTVRLATSDYLSSQDLFAQWLAEECDLSNANATSTVNALFEIWSHWAEKNRAFTGSRANLIEGLERFGVRVARTSAKRGICLGIAPKAEPADDPPF